MTLSDSINQAVECSIRHLAESLLCEILESDTHLAVVVSGWNEDCEAIRAIGYYLAGLRASVIDAALNIRAQMADTPEDRAELIQNVAAIVGDNNADLTDERKRKERNPWIAEGLWHMCMAISTIRQEFHSPGSIVALDYAHIAAKDHGTDIVAIYRSDIEVGLSIIECKAYRTSPNDAISDAVAFFQEVDQGVHALRLRQCVQIMRSALPLAEQGAISESFWKKTRTYIPNPHYDIAHAVDWTNPRPSFRSLQFGKQNIVIMPHSIPDFDLFFDQVADAMRLCAKEMANV